MLHVRLNDAIQVLVGPRALRQHRLCSEQGWLQSLDKNEMARQVCLGHAGAMQFPSVIGQTHFIFQWGVGKIDYYGQPAFSFGLVPVAAGHDLQAANGEPTYEAFRSTYPNVWNISRTHYCCVQQNVGCGP